MTRIQRWNGQARSWIVRARSFHDRQLAKPRRVLRIRNSKIVFTTGQAATTVGGIFAAGSAGSAGLPDWIFWALILGGYFGGRFAFPIPDSSIASKRGPADVTPRSASELDTMSPDDIWAYGDNMLLKYDLQNPEGLGTAQALRRQREAVQATANVAAVDASILKNLSVVEAGAYSAAAVRHDRLRRRWLAYEVDPQLQIDFPAMSDTAFPTTSAMIRAMRAADTARSAGHASEYLSAVDAFGEALKAAEIAAGVPGE